MEEIQVPLEHKVGLLELSEKTNKQIDRYTKLISKVGNQSFIKKYFV